MPVSRNSGRSPASRRRSRGGFLGALGALLLAAGLGSGMLWWSFHQGWTLDYGDAEARLNIARRILDSRTPGYEQIGTVWLPLPQVLLMPLAKDDAAWRSGRAAAGFGTVFFTQACLFFFLFLRRIFVSQTAAFVGLVVLGANPNLLYLQATPMTEPVFLAFAFAALYFLAVLKDSKATWPAAAAGAAATLAAMVRYEGWFLLPFLTAVAFALAPQRRLRAALLFAIPAGAGPVYWLLHNAWCCGDWLEFYRGPWSAKAIYQRQLQQGMEPYPGSGDWREATRYFFEAARLSAGWPLVVVGLVGTLFCLIQRVFWPVFVLALAPVFYVLSMASAGTPIFVPQLWPNSYYNTRYGLALLPLLAFGAAGLAARLARWRTGPCLAVIAVCLSVWMLPPAPDNWICWKEARVNSEIRRRWTHEAASYLREHYRGGGIISSFGDLTGIYRAAGIPLRETLHEGNGPAWLGVMQRPELFLHEEWAVAMSGDVVATALLRSRHRGGPRYRCVKMLTFRGGPVIEIYRRDSTGPPAPPLPMLKEKDNEPDSENNSA